MHLFEKQMFICDEHREPFYGLALGTGAGATLPALSWVGKEWSLVRECSSFHFGRKHFGLVIGPTLDLDLNEIHRLLDAMPTLEYPADYMSMVTSSGSLFVLSTKPVASSGLVVGYSTWFDGWMRIAMSKHCGPLLWFGTRSVQTPPTDLLKRIDRYAGRKKASTWGPGRIYLVDTQEFEECDCDVESDVWHEEMLALAVS